MIDNQSVISLSEIQSTMSEATTLIPDFITSELVLKQGRYRCNMFAQKTNMLIYVLTMSLVRLKFLDMRAKVDLRIVNGAQLA